MLDYRILVTCNYSLPIKLFSIFMLFGGHGRFE